MSLIHRKAPTSKPALLASDPLRNLTPFGPDNPSPAPFVRGHSGMKTGRTLRSRADIIRKFLECSRVSAKDEYGRTRIEQMVANLVQIATSPKHPHAVAAFVALCDRAYGRPAPSAEEAAAVAKGGITLVYVSRPAIDPDIPIFDEKDLQRQLSATPEFDQEGHSREER